MEPLKIVVYHNDPRTAQALAVSLSQFFNTVHPAPKYEDVRTAVTRDDADVLVIDLETSHSGEIGRLHREFPSLCIVGTHRLADEKMWAEALDQGAADVCEPRDDEVVRSVMREHTHRAAA
jgi:DNA-binding NtrC family response regulator